jgi:hypothetical protein
MDIYLVKHSLVDSYNNFCEAGEPYPFVPKRELKPRARVIEKEHIYHNRFLVLFCEGTIPARHKKHIRFFDTNKVTKEAIAELTYIQLHRKYSKNLRYFDNPGFETLVIDLLPVDYALLIQRDPAIKSRTRYAMTHFHVKIDWPIDNATEQMGQQLRYITKDLYENGEKYAENLNNKLFENYGFHHTVGGRRTAAVVAAQLLKNMDFISTVYVSSAEARALIRISERGVSKFVLIKLPIPDMLRLAEDNNLDFDRFVERYLVDISDDFGVAIFQVVYRNTRYSKPPDDGKLRKLHPNIQWQTVSHQLIIPLAGNPDIQPLEYSTIYTTDLLDVDMY